MEQQAINKFRALLLLMVFSLNTLAGFACSIGIDLGYNRLHHTHSTAQTVMHKMHCHGDREKQNNSNEKDDCCSNDVVKFVLLDKATVDNNHNILPAPIFLAAIAEYTAESIIHNKISVNTHFQFLRRSCFLNDTDIQTAIRRFQI